jgi:nucleoside-diphosphate-sugar epimerase
MKIIVIGPTGAIGSKVVEALSAGHEVVGVARGTEVRVDLEEPATIHVLFEHVRDVNAVISCAGNAVFKGFAELTDADYEVGLRSKLRRVPTERSNLGKNLLVPPPDGRGRLGKV